MTEVNTFFVDRTLEDRERQSEYCTQIDLVNSLDFFLKILLTVEFPHTGSHPYVEKFQNTDQPYQHYIDPTKIVDLI